MFSLATVAGVEEPDAHLTPEDCRLEPVMLAAVLCLDVVTAVTGTGLPEPSAPGHGSFSSKVHRVAWSRVRRRTRAAPGASCSPHTKISRNLKYDRPAVSLAVKFQSNLSRLFLQVLRLFAVPLHRD